MLVILVAAARPKTKVVFLNDGKGVSWASDLPAPSISIPAPAGIS